MILPITVVWDFNPVFFSIGSFDIRYYGLMWVLAILGGMLFFDQVCKREGLPQKVSESIFVYGTLATILGARLGHCFFYEPGYFLAGGAIVRLGNLFNSEIVGAVTDVSWGFKFVRLYPNVPIDSIPVQHPTQLYEALCYLVIFGILCWLYYGRDLGRRRPGVMFGVGLIGIFLTRFFIEFIKLDQEAFEQGMLLNMGQLLSIPFILVGIYMIYRGMHRSPVDPDTVRVVRQQTVRQQGGSSKPRKHRRMK